VLFRLIANAIIATERNPVVCYTQCPKKGASNFSW